LLLLGKGSHQFANEISKKYPDLKKRIHATGPLQDHDLSHHLSACDLVLQPFPDGLSTRRTSLMNALAHGIPVVSNSGHLTEEIWEENGSVALGATGTGPDLAPVCTRLLLDQSARKSFGEKGAELYRTRFDWPNILSVLRSSPDRKSAVAPK
jgi:glycosyltransferase involved in cell wall biosynthesis